MGHLVHPLAFRFGSFTDWSDSWFIRRVYYADFFHTMLKMRSFLTFYSNLSILEAIGFLPSHFCIVSLVKFFSIRIFTYNSDLEDSFSTFISRVFPVKWRCLNLFPKSHFFFYYVMKLFIVLFSLSHLIDIDWDLRFFVYFLIKLRNFSILNFLKYDILPISEDLRYFFLFFIYISQYVFYSEKIFKKYKSFFLLIKRLFFSYTILYLFLFFFQGLKFFLKNV